MERVEEGDAKARAAAAAAALASRVPGMEPEKLLRDPFWHQLEHGMLSFSGE